ncbi:3-oxoacyl-[acyl-carrier protein] reductase [Enhygromyxa salina]|uniref:3-oxoacyl-[acyl-carrier protein] reductase n=1 Tax=Enhygromyxa salina TaxID=215803 RepID=A0A0C2D1L5_9BACT|nr:3-oxoacyl-[acyl-carrier protein] reductase [Enhygromyxa salina]
MALVTGANRGIGKAIVKSFLNHGAKKVYLAVRNPESTAELEKQYGDQVVTLEADLADAASIKRLAEQAQDVDVVVNNAGVLAVSSPLDEKAEASLAYEFDINVYGLLRVAQSFAGILEGNQGALVQLNSVASIKNFADLSTYSASKAASYSLTQGLREKLGKKGVAVVSVHPGPIDTEMAAGAGFEQTDAPSSVSEAIVTALEAEEFHVFPDVMAKQFESAYQSFAENIVLADFSE